MCGIFGKFYFKKTRLIPEEFKENINCLRPRGPDDFGFYTDYENIILGSRRLAIIDLSSAGHMPMTNEDGSLWIVHNGEIYNFQEIRKNLENRHKFKSKTDTEVILHLYEEENEDCLKHLRGMFAFGIWNNKKKELFLARDRIGKKPLKYYFNNEFFIFASELKAILKDKGTPKEIDYSAIDEYLTYQYVPNPKTGFKNIFKLEPGHYLIVKESGKILKKRYWQLDYSQKLILSETEWEKQIIEKLKEAVKLRLISDVPLGSHLSGGIDSSLIIALMAQEMKKPIKTFSIGFQESDYNELPYAKLVAEKYQTEHYEFIVKPKMIEILEKLVYQYEEPYADSSALPTWYLCKLTKEYITVALNGDGGDENFAGYTRYNAMKLFQRLKTIPFKNQLKKINQLFYQISKIKLFQKGYRFLDSYNKEPLNFYLRLIDYFGQEEKELIYSKDLKQQIQNSRWHSFLSEKFNETKNFDWLDQILYADINSYLPDDLLVKVDIASMTHSLEIRSPFLDHEFLELTAKMPSDLKLRGQNKKYLLKKIAYRYLPKECIEKPKQGFGVPLEHWFRGDLKEYLVENLLNKNFLDFGFKREGIEKLIFDHKSFRQNYANHLWALLMLSQWFKIWFRS